jgi:hypothetical protein
MFNGSITSVDKFPSIALDLYRRADHLAPNRAINTLGMARSNVFLDQHSVSAGLYQQLFYQMTSSNNNDESFLKEADEYLSAHSSAMNVSFSFSLVFFFTVLLYFSMKFQ